MNPFDTHEVFNQASPFADVNLFDCDRALQEGLVREGGGWAAPALRPWAPNWGGPTRSTLRGWPTPTRRGLPTSTAPGAASTRSSSTRPGTA
jgi:hypothetical protein